MKKLYNTETILKTHYGDEEFVKSMAELFIIHLPEMSAELQKASTKKDWEGIYFYAHKMKATIDLFSIESLTDIIRKLEKQSKSVVDLKALNKDISPVTDSKTLKQDVKYVADVISACVAQLKNDFALA